MDKGKALVVLAAGAGGAVVMLAVALVVWSMQPGDPPKPGTPAGPPDEWVAAAQQPYAPGEKPDPADPRFDKTTPGGVKYRDVVEGTGEPAKAGQTILAHYTGWLVDGGSFDSSTKAGRAYQTILGPGHVIRGWVEGIAGMKPGGVRYLVIPPDLGYAAKGFGSVIPPHATLLFEIKLMGAK
jgi:FKBP-type peptidyl-prolyl cis-trans isomerase